MAGMKPAWETFWVMQEFKENKTAPFVRLLQPWLKSVWMYRIRANDRIENPERLGLAQLHQLRGRKLAVVRSQSHCVLLYHPPII